MSVATEFAPTVYIPSHYVPSDTATPGRAPSLPHGIPDTPPERPARLATVTTLHRPSPRSIATPVRLTRRGVAVMAAVVVLACIGLVWLAWRSAPASSSTSTAVVPATVTVRSGDTLWSIAGRVAPDRDTRAEVAELQRINHLGGVDLMAGQVLRTR